MLQIITGRFFGDGSINERMFDKILYSNFSWIQPIVTNVGELCPSDAQGTRISSFIFRYSVRYQPRQGDPLILPIGDQVADHFRLLAGLWFSTFFHPDRYHVEMLCRQEPRNSSDSGVPSRFVNAFFNAPATLTTEAVKGFSTFIDKVVRMPRKAYRLFISCLGAFFDALEAIDTNRDLAYSMFVYVLEGLTQGSDNFTPTWDDYPQNTRVLLDEELVQIEAQRADSIRKILLKNPNLKLMKRFIEFVMDHVDDSFFTGEALGQNPALRKNELQQTLGNLYRSRSGYVHTLSQIQEHLRLPGWNQKADVFHWQHEPHLTFSGLARLCRHVLLCFVERQRSLEQEEYPNWRMEISGIITAEVAPEYWIWQVPGFQPSRARTRFNGLIEHLVCCYEKKTYTVPDMRDLLKRIEELTPCAKSEDRPAMLCIYWLYNACMSGDGQRPQWEEFLSQYTNDIETCSIEVIATTVLLGLSLTWSVEECERIFWKYLKNKFKTNAVNLPPMVEIAIMVAIANLLLATGNHGAFEVWMERAILDASGRGTVQEILRKARADRQSLHPSTVLGIHDPPLQETLQLCC